MNIYKISQSINNNYDTYDSAVVIAASVEEARNTLPSPTAYFATLGHWDTWAESPDQVEVELIGTALEGSVPRVVCASFNAG